MVKALFIDTAAGRFIDCSLFPGNFENSRTGKSQLGGREGGTEGGGTWWELFNCPGRFASFS